MKEFEYIDLFSGCGGLALGMHLASWKAKFAIEKNADAFQTLSANLLVKEHHFNWPNWLPQKNHDINEVNKNYKEMLKSLRGNLWLVAGGPPCQGFSSAGNRDEKDHRNNLVDSYLDFIDLVEPEAVFFENVKGFTVSFKGEKGKNYSTYIVNELKKKKYSVEHRIVDFSQFGVPQKRNRYILFACKNDNPSRMFDILYNNIENYLKRKKLNQLVTVQEAISDLEKKWGTAVCNDSSSFRSGKYGVASNKYEKYCRQSIDGKNMPDSHRFANHKIKTVRRFEELQELNVRNKNLSKIIEEKYAVKKNCMILLCPNSPAPTLTSNPDDYIHYQEARTLTVREYARIQSFPDWYEFKGNYTTGGMRRRVDVPRYTQIANAIPPIFSEQVGIALSEFFSSYSEK